MAATNPLPVSSAELTRDPRSAGGLEITNQEALVQSPPPIAQQGVLTLNPRLARLPVELDVAVPVREFRVRNLLTLEPGQVIETQWLSGEDLPLAAGAAQLFWSEFEVVESRLAVRVTRLA
jgi:flagellar motor switch protein FliM